MNLIDLNIEYYLIFQINCTNDLLNKPHFVFVVAKNFHWIFPVNISLYFEERFARVLIGKKKFRNSVSRKRGRRKEEEETDVSEEIATN